MLKYFALSFIAGFFCSCHSAHRENVPVVGFVDAFEDVTLAPARTGFVDALRKKGFSEAQKNIKIEYRNAQNSPTTLLQIVNYFISEKVDLMATCPTASSIAAAQRTKTIPIFVMVSPTVKLMNLNSTNGHGPGNLFGAVEDINYIDTSYAIIAKVLKPKSNKLVVGLIYDESEPQSVDARKRIEFLSTKLNIQLETLPLNSSADAQLVTQSLLNKNLDAFFALPDDKVFDSFATILKNCDQKGVPIFTSEAGLVQRGAVAAFGADIYQWGFQAGEQAALYLKNHSTTGLQPEMVKVRNRVYNPAAAKKYHIIIPSNFEAVK
jgi:putative ABC transport system substrate-binding protein